MKNNVLQQIISHFTIALILLTVPLNIVIANNKQGEPDKTLQKEVNNWMAQSAIGFEENKGQLADHKGNPNPDIFFKLNAGGMDMYITTSGITYIFTKTTKISAGNIGKEKFNNNEEAPVKIQRSRVDMNLSGASIKKENIITEQPLAQGNLNYYLGHCPDGILGVQVYQKVTIKAIYPGVDWILYASPSPTGRAGEGLKYDFIVHPGADPSKIKMCKGSGRFRKVRGWNLKNYCQVGRNTGREAG